MSSATIKRRSRAEAATESLGPVGYLISSPAAARLLNLLVDRPRERFRFTELEERTGVAKRSLQVCLLSLSKAGLIVREGQTYCFAIGSPLARPIAEAIEVSRRVARLPRIESFADSVVRWASTPAGSCTVEGPTIDDPTPETTRIAHMKQLPDTPLHRRTASESAGAFVL